MFDISSSYLEEQVQGHQFHQFTLMIIAIVLAVFSFTATMTIVVLLMKQRRLEKKVIAQNKQIHFLQNDSRNAYLRKLRQLNEVIDDQTRILNNITGLSLEQAKQKLAENLKFRYRSYFNQIAADEKRNIEENAEKRAQEILISTMEGMLTETVSQRTTTTIKLPDDKLKAKIIGKEGKNKRLFEALTGVDVIIEKQPEVTLSCTNPIRRQLAKNVMEALVNLKNIEINRIESVFSAEQEKFENFTIKTGREMLEDKLKIYEFDSKLYAIVGRLYYRYSYGQNVLQHCFEAANIAMIIAQKLNLDVEKAKRAAFFHDIGKAVDFETSYDHVACGLKVANEFDFPEYVKNAIESHHNNVEPNNVYSAITKIADEISASRPGARIDNYNEYIKQVEELEKIAMSFPAVVRAYGMRSGRILRVIVEPDKIADDQLDALGQEIAEKIENNPLTNLHALKVIMIREKRLEFTANVDGKNKKII